jgi:hypothetical protein
MSILVDTLLERVQKEFSLPEPEWVTESISDSDMEFLEEECTKESEFDPFNKRKKMYEDMLDGYNISLKSKCDYGELIVILEDESQLSDLPLGLWGRIFRMFQEKDKKPFRVFFLANKSLRRFPDSIYTISPENINGGYTYRCNKETICIYRAEDATRVLIHELQHSCCLDNIEKSLDEIEAETEAWAELFYVAILSQGKKYIFKDMIQRQSEWMKKQNIIVRHHMGNPNSREFPWRYTIGKEEIWRRWNIFRDDEVRPIIKVGKSLRLTYPPSKGLKEKFEVSINSAML